MYRMEAVMASELAQLESQPTPADTPVQSTEIGKEDVDFQFNGKTLAVRGLVLITILMSGYR